MSRIKKHNKKIIKYTVISLIVIIAIIVGFKITLGKYKINNNTSHIQKSEEFYFESDLLGVDDEEPITYTDWNVLQGFYYINFNIRNYVDELRYNNLETTYELEVSTENTEIDIETYINENETLNGEMLANQKVEDNIKIKITANDIQNIENEEISLNIKVKSTSPYAKTLNKVVNVIPKKEDVEEIKSFDAKWYSNEGKDYGRLVIHTDSSFSGRLKIAYDSSKINPDTIYSIFNDVSINEVTEEENYYYIDVALQPNANYEIDFIKTSNDVELINNIENYDIVIG